jgi:putative phosphoribosyl transferase
MQRFLDRRHAGQALAERLGDYADRPDVVVLGIPRGGVPVAYEIARRLRAPLDIFLVRKLAAPGHGELALGAIASGGVRVLNEDVVHDLGVSRDMLDAITQRAQAELERRERQYRRDRAPRELSNRVAILVDDGLATGATIRAAAITLRRRNPARVIVAVPVAAAHTYALLSDEVDDVVSAEIPDPFYAVGVRYEDFSQTTDEEVRDLLDHAGGTPQAA